MVGAAHTLAAAACTSLAPALACSALSAVALACFAALSASVPAFSASANASAHCASATLVSKIVSASTAPQTALSQHTALSQLNKYEQEWVAEEET